MLHKRAKPILPPGRANSKPSPSAKKRKQSQKRKETKRNEGRVNKKRRVEDVEDVEVDKKRRVEDVEKLEDVFANFNIEDDDVPDRQYIETHGVVHPDV